MDQMYRRRYNADKFIPAQIENAITAAWEERRGKASLIFDKNATPAEPAASVEELNATLRPLEIVAERSSRSMSEAHNEYGSVFQKFQTLDVQTGSAMLPQFRPQYIGMAFPFTWPAAVGGVDIPGQERWRRPTWEEAQERLAQPFPKDMFEYWPGYEEEMVVGAAEVKIFDLTRSMSQRIEGQYRRHWGFIPGLWNLYFREQVNLNVSLSVATMVNASEAQESVEQDAAVAS